MQSVSYVAPPRRSPHLRLKGLLRCARRSTHCSLNSTRMSELARRSPVAYSALFSHTALSMTLLVVRSRVLSQRTGRCTMPGNDARILIHVTHATCVLLGRGRCAGGGARGGGSGGGGSTGRHAGRVIALIIYRRGPRLTFYRYRNSRTHGTLAWRAINMTRHNTTHPQS